MSSEQTEDEITDDLQLLSGGASWFLLGRVFRNGVELAINILLTNSLGAALYGLYALGYRMYTLFSTFAHLGANQAILRYVPEYDGDRKNNVFGLALVAAFAGGVLFASAIFVTAPLINEVTLEDPLFVSVLRFFALLLSVQAILSVFNSAYRSKNAIAFKTLIDDVIYPTLKILLVFIALTAGFSVVGATAGILLAGVLTLICSLYVLAGQLAFRPKFGFDITESKSFLNFSIPLVFSDIGWVLITKLDVLMVGYFLSSSVVAIYNVSVLVSAFMLMPLSALNQLFPPLASRLYSEEKHQSLDSVFKTVTRWVLTITLPTAAGLIIFRKSILQVFGPEFVAGGGIFTTFVVVQLLNGAVGPSGYLLMITDHQYMKAVNHWAFGILNVVLNVIFILQFGAIGAAIATAISISGLNISRLIEVRYFEGYFPYSTTLWKPIVATAIALIPLVMVKSALDGVLSVFIGAVFGAIVYFTCLIIFGLEPEDFGLMRTYISE